MKEEYINHPSFGLISFSRVQTNGKMFFGSEIEQSNYIVLKIHNAFLQRDLINDKYYEISKDRIIELRMTCGQFSELITSLNLNSGVPCTLEFIGDKEIEMLPNIQNRKDFVLDKFNNEMKSFAKNIKDKQQKAIEIVKKKALSKNDIDELTNHLEYLTSEITNNIPYFAKRFQETADKVVLDAKTEIENSLIHKVNLLGLQALSVENSNKQLNE